jgi:PIN domain nuclease of toxin-antitoxin system
VLLWYLFDEQKLSKTSANILKNLDVEIYMSAANFWEISIKQAVGKLDLKGLYPIELLGLCIGYGFKMLDIAVSDAASFHQLANTRHREPFDRMLIWQAIQNKIALISKDANMPFYKKDGLKLLW